MANAKTLFITIAKLGKFFSTIF